MTANKEHSLRVLEDNDGNRHETVKVYPRDLRPGDLKPRFRAINVGTIAERTVFECEKVESTRLTKGLRASDIMNVRHPSTYSIVLVAPDGSRRTFNTSPQSRIEILKRG